MNKLEQLKARLDKMPNNERLALLGQTREDRKISKQAVTVTKKREQDKQGKLAKQFENLTKEERAELLAKLKEEVNEGTAS
jgi:hypothetical protein|tara:strand:- start:6432 stop:6674 length:243 start_codon:yes stop_codon:yes gene_type:complete